MRGSLIATVFDGGNQGAFEVLSMHSIVGDASRFDELLGALRASEEWTHVDGKVEIRLVHDV